jgi:hypothetical protein
MMGGYFYFTLVECDVSLYCSSLIDHRIPSIFEKRNIPSSYCMKQFEKVIQYSNHVLKQLMTILDR